MLSMVKHCMTIRTYWDKISCRINYIRLAYLCYRFNVVNMYESFTYSSIYFLKIESTYGTFTTISFYALASCFRATFVTVYNNSRFCAFWNFVIWISYLIRIRASWPSVNTILRGFAFRVSIIALNMGIIPPIIGQMPVFLQFDYSSVSHRAQPFFAAAPQFLSPGSEGRRKIYLPIEKRL